MNYELCGRGVAILVIQPEVGDVAAIIVKHYPVACLDKLADRSQSRSYLGNLRLHGQALVLVPALALALALAIAGHNPSHIRREF